MKWFSDDVDVLHIMEEPNTMMKIMYVKKDKNTKNHFIASFKSSVKVKFQFIDLKDLSKDYNPSI